MSATTDRRAELPSSQESGDTEAAVYIAFERVEQLAGKIKDQVEEERGATASECWTLHYAAYYYRSWAESIITKANELQELAMDLGLNGIEAGIIDDPWTGSGGAVEKTNKALERILAARRADDA